MKIRLFAAFAAILLLGGCKTIENFQPVSTLTQEQICERATGLTVEQRQSCKEASRDSAEFRYFQFLGDYGTLSEDANAYIGQLSTTVAEAEAVDAVLDEADKRIAQFELVRILGEADERQFSTTILALQGLRAEIVRLTSQ